MADRIVNPNDLKEFTKQAFLKLGCSETTSEDAASILLWASLRGIDTHGIRNLVPYYVDNIRAGQIDCEASLTIEHETAMCLRTNGNSGLGLANAAEGMRVAIQKAHESGIGMVAVHNTHHLGPAGYYAHMAIEHGMLGFCSTGHFFGKGSEVGVPPVNGLRPMFSTNPLSFAAPCGRNPPFVLDMSTATATVNRIEMLGQCGQPIPDGWARNQEGHPTNDPNEATVLYPLGGVPTTGGHKGIGLSMMVSILTGVLSSGWSQVLDHSEFDQPTMGHLVAAVRIDQFLPLQQFVQAMDAFTDSIQNGTRVDEQDSIEYPGSQEFQTAQSRTRTGIPIDERLYDELVETAHSLSISKHLLDS